MNKIIKYSFLLFLLLVVGIKSAYSCFQVNNNDQQAAQSDTIKKEPVKLKYPFKHKIGYPFSNSGFNSKLYLELPDNIKSDVRFDTKTGNYIFSEKIGQLNYRNPNTMTLDEYRMYELEKYVKDTWRQKFNNVKTFEVQRSLVPSLRVGGQAFDKIFGGNTINISPAGSADLSFGLQIQKTENPNIPEKLQRTTTFDFKNKINMSVNGQIGQKVRVGINYDTHASFDFQNKTNLKYEGLDDEIIKNIEAGNVSLPLTGSLITGSHSLFGLKTEMQFGKLRVTSIFSQQKGKSSVIDVEGGATTSEFEVLASDYEANRHFFLSHYFKNIYDRSLENLPVISSGVTITKVEVWVTNKTNDYTNSRNILALLDLAESENSIFNSSFINYNPGSGTFPSNELNNLYEKLSNQYAASRDINQVTTVLGPLSDQYGFVVGQDYEKIENGRKLEQNEFDYHPNLGYISLRSALNTDEILAVAYEYNIGGEVYRVGEFSNDVTLVDGVKNPTLFLKLLKGTNLSPSLPTWELMMKNIYSLNAYQVNPEDFHLDVLYQDDKTGTAINYLPAGGIDGEILLKVLNLDNLNFQLDPQPDGVFDFIDGVTINANNGKLIFPVVEPFGKYLRDKIENNNPANTVVADEYVFEELYTMTQSRAQQIAQKNKFYISGRYKGSSSSEIQIGANIPQGAVVVTANGRNLTENQDYTVDYNMGTVKIINESILKSGTPIRISLESQSTFGVMNKSLIGSHLQYQVSNDFSLGGTILHLKERPLTKKVSIGDEPISNTILGLNVDYRNNDMPFITRMIDKLPFIETKERSSISFNGEFAQLIPGHSKAIEKEGVSYLDDFEGSQTSIDIKQRFTWLIASVPQFQDDLFPEAKLTNDYSYGYNRAKLAWYNIDPLFLRNNSSTPNHIANNQAQQLSHFTREIQEREIFPNKESPNNIPQNISVLNLAFYPDEKGPYNYDANGNNSVSAGIDNEGKLKDPESRWGGIMREIRQNDFEAANIEYIEFWMMDPFVEDEQNNVVRNDDDPGFYFNLGNISEDILKDSRKSFENGLPSTEIVSLVDTTVWGRVPLSQSYVNAFDNDDNSRQYQDIGLDGLNDDDEKTFFKSYLDSIDKLLTPSSQAWNSVYGDPSGDNYHYFRGRDFDTEKLGILERYKMFNGLDGNSPTSQQSNESYPTSATTIPDGEDINQDNTLSETEAYFQYKIRMSPEDMVVGSNFITDKVNGKNKEGDPVTWYQFKVPVYEPEKVVGSIQDFKSIRFMRMFLKGFSERVILRFATLELVRGEWRKYNYSLREGSEYTSIPEVSNGSFEVSAVNIEENGSKTPVNYVLPPGIDRVTDPANAHIRMLNEQSMVLKVTDLDDGDAKAAYKNVSVDVRQYKKLQLDVHAEAFDENTLFDNDLVAFIRIGSDYTQNYYEYEIPLALTPHLLGSSRYDNYNLTDRYTVWPEQNHMEIPFLLFQQVKQERNDIMRQAGSTVTINTNYFIMDGNNKVIVKGNPNLSNIRTIMLGVRNPSKAGGFYSSDDGLPKSGEIWMNELRLTDFDESGGWAGVGRLTTTLADFGRITLSGNTKKPGFGSIEKKVNDRLKDEINQYDISSTFELGKFFPKKAGVKIPVFFGFSEGIRNPKYNPLDPDIPLSAALDNAKTKAERDTIIHNAQDYTRRKSFNLSNIKIEPERKRNDPRSNKPLRFYSVSNFTVSYAFNEIFARNVNTEFRINRNYSGNFAYNYIVNRPKMWEPFKKSNSLKGKAWKIIKDFNLYYQPSRVSFISNINRQYGEEQLRNLSNPSLRIDPTFNKNFTWFRKYDVKFDLTKTLKFLFTADNNSRIDEPIGRMNKDDDDYQLKRDSIWNNFKNGGRTTKYHHTAVTSYTLPINKISFLSWANLKADYTFDYDWDAGPITSSDINLGNVIQNSNSLTYLGTLTFSQLYSKIGFIKKIDQKYKRTGSRSKKKFETVKYDEKDLNFQTNVPKAIQHKLLTENIVVKVFGKGDKPIEVEYEILNNKSINIISDSTLAGARIEISGEVEIKQNPLVIVGENIIRFLTGVKTLSINYSSQNGTILPGFDIAPQLLGQRSVDGRMAPGWAFIAGAQNDEFGDFATNYNWVTTDSSMVRPFTMGHNENLMINASLRPIDGLRISLKASRRFSRDLSQHYIYENGEFGAHNRLISGSFSMSISTLKTSFKKNTEEGDQYISEVFEQFKANRTIISNRLAEQRVGVINNNPGGSYNPLDSNRPNMEYKDGFGPTSQQVTLSAFLSAYTGKDPEKVSLSTFPSAKSLMPNWNITYDGLSKIFKSLRSLKLTHDYKSLYTIGGYTTSSQYLENIDGLSYVRDVQNDFFPELQIGSVLISERFSPLIGINMVMTNSLDARIEITREREVNLSFNNNQVMDTERRGIVLHVGYRFKNVLLKITTGGKPRSFNSDLNVNLDLKINKNRTIIRKLTEEYNQISLGKRNITINISSEYKLSSRLALKFFYDQKLFKPEISTSYATSDANVGISVKFTLS